LQVTLRASEQLTLVPHPEFDRHVFRSLDDLAYVTETRGYYGGERLLRATCKKFAHLCTRAGLTIHLQRNFTMSYDTNIPRMVGLAGSSAIVSAALRGLMHFYGISAEDLNIDKATLPQIVLDIEVGELGISAGLQDRVIQIYGGLVHMDFTEAALAENGMKHGTYTELDCSLLPPLYLAYDARVGKESGKTHSTVRQRWAERDPELVQGMKDIAGLADQAVVALQNKNYGRLAELMETNFATRRRLYGDKVVGAKNVRLAEVAAQCGLAAKFTGSGGAFVCVKKIPVGDGADPNACALSAEEEEHVRELFSREGFELERIRPTAAGNPSHVATADEGIVKGMVLQID
jgi:glucuronokinase